LDPYQLKPISIVLKHRTSSLTLCWKGELHVAFRAGIVIENMGRMKTDASRSLRGTHRRKNKGEVVDLQ